MVGVCNLLVLECKDQSTVLGPNLRKFAFRATDAGRELEWLILLSDVLPLLSQYVPQDPLKIYAETCASMHAITLSN